MFVLGQSTPNTNSRQKRSGNRNYERKFDPKEIENVSLYYSINYLVKFILNYHFVYLLFFSTCNTFMQ